MASTSGISWTDATWNCLAGCEAVSPGCANCYAATMTRRLEAMGQKDYTGLTTAKHFNGTVRCLPDKLSIPLKWRKSRRVFVNSMSDLFHEDVPDEFIDRVFAVMALCPNHTFQVLTKRAERMQAYMELLDIVRLSTAVGEFKPRVREDDPWLTPWREDVVAPFERTGAIPNVWLGVSCERQQEADERIPWLLKTPAAVRFLSCEPLLGPIDLHGDIEKWAADCWIYRGWHSRMDKVNPIQWVIVGGESGGNRRSCQLAWITSIVEQCKAAGVPVFVKQDAALRSGKQGRIPDDVWATKEFPAIQEA